MEKLLNNKFIWPILAIIISLIFKSPAISLLFGMVIALIWNNPLQSYTGRLSKSWLQLAVILIGFGLQLDIVLKVGASSVGFTFMTIALTLLLGLLIGKLFKIESELSTLISGGTAICGGSAIAAISPAINANSANTAVSLAVVFLLNAVALLVFPVIGHFFGLDQISFGIWSAVAIHDTSSVIGAASIYGATALAIGTTVKLTRALWILPVSLTLSKIKGSKNKTKIPWFLLFFLFAALTRSILPSLNSSWDLLAQGGKILMTMSLFMVGAGLTRATIKNVGLRPLLMALILWIIVAGVTLTTIVLKLPIIPSFPSGIA